jgi:tRNA-specific 2-thiouridylase
MRVVVAMSGGVDSSVAAAVLAAEGHDVIGLSMQLYDQSGTQAFGSCCTLDDLHDARRVAAAIGVPHYILNFERQFQQTWWRTSSASTSPDARPSPARTATAT